MLDLGFSYVVGRTHDQLDPAHAQMAQHIWIGLALLDKYVVGYLGDASIIAEFEGNGIGMLADWTEGLVQYGRYEVGVLRGEGIGKWIIKWQLGEEHEGWESREQGVELLIRTIELCAGRSIIPEIAPSKETPYDRLTYLTLSICNHIHQEMLKEILSVRFLQPNHTLTYLHLIYSELVQRVLDHSDDLNQDTKKTFLTIVKSFYYKAHCPSATRDVHLSKVLFERVD
ncbi:Ent-copalyl diphosphate synthase 2 [Acorus calamus]|uniref:Ent-copalyl diphosphate synthase 2 n=1 Tax=Acorus calamus TaxID=4465 RepID=A0AAV9C550_ACOCL|nr:Ent-copalyl diphosphate synthase 2 [Acorus calamus]